MRVKLSGEELHLRKLYRDRDGLQKQLENALMHKQARYTVWLRKAIKKLTVEISQMEERKKYV